MPRQNSPARRNATRRVSSPKRKKSEQSRPRTITTLFIGICVGVFATLLTQLYLGERDNTSSRSAGASADKQAARKAPTAKTPAERTNKKKANSQPAPKFDFYEILEKDEVKVDVSASPQVKPLANDQEFILQVASFRNEEDADRLRAELILLNLDAKSQKAVLDNGDVWHRVMVGPYSSQSKVASARATLLSNKHDALLLKRKK